LQTDPLAATPPGPDRFDGWRGIALVAGTYVYFLIFAQFGFLKRAEELGIAGDYLKPVMGAMAIGGIFASLLSPRFPFRRSPSSRLRVAWLGCGLAAAFSLLPLKLAGLLLTSLLIGISLGLLTVTLVANLPIWIGRTRPLYKVGLGTGLGYLICNCPPLFTAAPKMIAFSALSACLLAIAVASPHRALVPVDETPLLRNNAPAFVLVLVWFTALVWLDSAAFFIIQNSTSLKSGTWQGSGQLWRIGGLHLVAALGGAWLLSRRGVPTTLIVAFAWLAGACLLLLDPSSRAHAAALMYPAGVSIYSVALVAYPSYLVPSRSETARSRRAGLIYAVAGWIGSAMGIGMAQNLHAVPSAFVVVTSVLFFLPLIWRLGRSYKQEALVFAAVSSAALALQHLLPHLSQNKPESQGNSLVDRGRRVYISEGCINCHSQYVRPNSPEVEIWGPVGNLDAIRREQPPLIGNRRQGPDLSEVGSRRSPLWLRIHLINPRDVSHDSVMPRYGYLFRDTRGDALTAYLSSLKTPDSSEHLRQVITSWQPVPEAARAAERLNGSELFRGHCATCHEADGQVRRIWSSQFERLPPNLFSGSILYSENESIGQRHLRIAQIIKFGLPGTDMPGHEYLPDDQVEAIANWIAYMRQRVGQSGLRDRSSLSQP
jgi:cbb3-type cytochrome oxidase cytochrome c subunit